MLAIALARRGVSVDLAEISPQWHGVGHGITVQGNLLAALDKVGALGAVLDRGVPFNQLRMRQADGTLIAEVPTPRTGGPALPATLGALRSDLQAVLCECVYASGVTVRLGLSPGRSPRTPGGLTLSSPTAAPAATTWSSARTASGPRCAPCSASPPRPSRPACPSGGWSPAGRRRWTAPSCTTAVPGTRPGTARSRRPSAYAYLLDVDGAQGDFGTAPAWRLMYERSAGYGGTWGKIRETIGPDSSVSHTRIEWLLVDEPWHRGRAVVIGDAAHACPPLIAQGAAMCAEDAVVLAELVTGGLPVEQALPAFTARRMPRVELVVRNSMRLVRWEMGLEPHTDADVARVMSSTLGFLAASEP